MSSPVTVAIAVGSVPGYRIIQVTALDADALDGRDEHLQYSLRLNSDSANFDVDARTGWLSVKRQILRARRFALVVETFDGESSAFIDVIVNAYDAVVPPPGERVCQKFC